MAGGNARQIRESAATGPINALSHPFIGPPARALFVGVTGQDPYVTGLRDREGRPGLQLLPADTKGSSFPHLGAAVREVSGVQGRLGEATGFLPLRLRAAVRMLKRALLPAGSRDQKHSRGSAQLVA